MVNFKEINFEGKDMLTVYLNGREVLSTIRIENLKNPDDDKNLIFNLGISIVNIKKTDVKSLYIKIKDPFHFIFESINFMSNIKSEDLPSSLSILKPFSVLTSGCQSWSKGFEYLLTENQTNIRLRKDLLRFIKSDYEPKIVKKGKFVSSFFMHFIERFPSEKAITVISTNHIYPTTFIYDKKENSLYIDLGLRKEQIDDGFIINWIYFCFENSSSELQENLKFLFSDHLKRNLSMLEKFEIFDKSTEHIYGWESWYNYYTNVNEKVVIENLEKLSSFFNKKTVFQIDDGWEKVVGQWEQDIEKFPTPLEKLSDTISKSLSVPGIWIAPLALLKDSKIYHEKKEWILRNYYGKPVVCGNVPLWGGDFYTFDLSIQDVRDFIVEQIDLLIEKYRFSYIKLDFLYCGLLDGIFKNAGHGSAYYYNLFMEELVKKVNDRAILLGCGAFLQLSFPYFQVMRIGADTKEKWEYSLAKIAGYEGRPSAYMSLTDTIARSILNKTVFFSDPDVCFFRKSKTKLNDDEKFLINIVNYIAGSQIMISDDLDDIDMNLKEKVFAFYEFLNLKNFYIRRCFKKDLYFLYDDKKQIFGFINLSNRKYTFKKADFKLIFFDHEISKLFVYHYDFEKKIYQSEVENICIKPHQIIFWQKDFG